MDTGSKQFNMSSNYNEITFSCYSQVNIRYKNIQESVESMNRDLASERFVTENPIDKVELSVNDDTIECWLNVVKYRMTSNNISGALLTAILQVTNSIVGKDDLFLRSLTLIKSWVFFESKRYTFLGEG